MITKTIGLQTGADFGGYDDTWLYEGQPTTAQYLTASTIYTGSNSAGQRCHAVMSFSGISNITGPVTVSSATVYIKPEDAPATSRNFSLYSLKVANTISQETWNDRATGTAWTSGGALNSTDADLTALATVAIASSDNFNYVAFTGPGLETWVQGVINGTITNNNLMMALSNDTAYDGLGTIAFRGGSASAAHRPYLEIVYTAGAPGPTVTSVTQTSGGTEGSPAVMTVALSGATSGSTNFAATLVGVTATGSGTDFTSDLASATYSNGVTFSGGNMVVPDAVSGWTVTIATTGDTLDEANETATLTVGGTAGTLTITDDDAAPTITGTASSTVTAGDPVVITYSPGLSGQTRTYTLALTDGTATGGTDYDNTTVTGDFAVTAGTGSVSISGSTVTVDPGVTEFTLSIGTTA